MESSPFYCNKWMNVLAVILVNGAAWGLFQCARKIAPGIPKNSANGFYLVMMPLGFLAIWSWNDPVAWFAYGFAVAGLLLIARCWPLTTRTRTSPMCLSGSAPTRSPGWPN